MTPLDTADYPRTFPVAGPLQLSVRLGSGDLTVSAADVTEAVVDLRPAHPGDTDALDLIAESRVELRGDSLLIHVPDRHSMVRARRTPAVLVHAQVPTGSSVTAELGSADLEIHGRIGALEVQLGSGDLTAAECADASVRSGSGDVDLGTVTAALVKSGSGDITIRASAGDLQLQSGSGDIEVGDAGANGLISTGSGDVELGRTRGALNVKTASGSVTAQRATEGELTVNTASGDVTVGITEGTVARLECSSVTGRVQSQLEPGDAPATTERRLLLNARTVSGDITVHRTTG